MKGQATTEYLVLLSVLAVGLIVAAWAFYPLYADGLDGLDDDAGSLIAEGTKRGSGDMR